MAEWKKVVVSGSAVSQLNNDSGYLISGQSAAVSLSGSFSGSFTGDGSNLTGISADTLGNSLTDGSGIADFTFDGSQAVSIAVQNDGTTLTVGGGGVKVSDAGITATQIATSVAGNGLSGGAGTALSVNFDGTSITSSGDNLTLAGTVFSSSVDSRISSAQSLATTNSASIAALDTDFVTEVELTALSSSLAARDKVNEDDIDALESNVATLQAATGSYALNSALTSVSSSLAARDAVNEGEIDTLQAIQGALVAATASYALDSALTSVSSSLSAKTNTNASDISTLQLRQGALIAATGSYALDSALTSVSSSLASDKQDKISVSDTSGQGGIDLTFSANDISGTVVGLGASDNVQFADILATGDVVVNGDLTVQGTTTSINTTNLDVEDKFILLNSGSASPEEGGIVIDEGSGTGHAFLLDSASTRFGFKAALDSTTSGDVTPEAFVSAVVDVPAGHADTAEYQKNGNIKVVANGDIFIYS